MIVVMGKEATQEDLERVVERIHFLGYRADINIGELRKVIGVLGDTRERGGREILEILPGVEQVISIMKPFKLVSREYKQRDSVVSVDGGIEIGGKEIIIMAGPCAVESREQVLETAWAVKRTGFPILRGGAFKPRTSPYAFQGLEEAGLELLAEARAQTGVRIITEVMSEQDIDMVARYADILQIGSRMMHAFRFLESVARANKPILLKRGFHATIREWLLSAEYILKAGNPNVILCERGIRSFDSEFTRNVLDLAAVQVVKKETHLPIIVDPSHGTGRADLIIPMSIAAIAAGADGLLIEAHPRPETAASDGAQSLALSDLPSLAKAIKPFAEAAGRVLWTGVVSTAGR